VRPPRPPSIAVRSGLWALLVLAGPAAGPPAGAATLEPAFARIDAFVRRVMRADRTPGLALAVTDRNRTLRVATYGFANLDARTPVAPGTLFQIGSISKSFTAVALLQERDRGRFDPLAPITAYLPWFDVRTKFDPITGHHLLTHTSGLPRDRDSVPSSLFQAAGVADLATGSAPGTFWAYSNIGYQVLGYALEAIAGRPYAAVIEERIFAPLGMRASAAAITHDLHPRLAVGYTTLYDDRPPRPDHPIVPATWFEYGGGDGSIAATAGDLAAYARMLLNRGAGPRGRIVSEEGFALLTRKAVPTGDGGEHYGYGLAVREADGRDRIEHGGGMLGFSAHLMVNPDAGVGAVVMVNGPGAPAEAARFALRAVRAARAGRPPPPLPPRPDPRRIDDAAGYAGTFTAPDGRRLVFTSEGGRLLLGHAGRRLPLETLGGDGFFADHPDFALFPLRFGRAAAPAGAPPGPEDGAGPGGPRGPVVEVTHGGDWYAGEGYAGPRAFDVPDEWRALPGHYRTAHPWFSNFRVVLRRGGLWLLQPRGGQQPLAPLRGGAFRVGADPRSAERLRFDRIVDGRALRATLSGVEYYRTFTP
jgi:CubicO group peptidase (beta-lactamase class C family)